MGTRCTITVHDADESFTVYRHWDGYPSTVLQDLRSVFPKAWELPRFEASDFAAAIIAAWKTEGGNIRFSGGIDDHGDTEYHYDLGIAKGSKDIFVAVYERMGDEDAWISSGYFLVSPKRVKNVRGPKVSKPPKKSGKITQQILIEKQGEKNQGQPGPATA